MKVRWEDLDLTAWDAAHAAAAASLQQDSAYGVAMQKMGVQWTWILSLDIMLVKM